MNPRKITLLSGGFSAEREVSLKSGAAVKKALLELGYKVQDLDLTVERVARLIDDISDFGADLVFVALHGPFGEDGTVQGLFEMAGLPYTGSGVLASALAMDKIQSKRLFEYHKIPTPKWVALKGDDTFEPVFPLGREWVVKPSNQGSTIGVTIVKKLDSLPAGVALAFQYSPDILVERYIAGRELTVGVLGDEALDVVEIRPKQGFYDYAAKYTKGMTEYLFPAPIPDDRREQVRALGLKAHQVLGCSGATRVDLRLTERGEPFVLEVNTSPGMTELSLLPMSAVPCGYDYAALVQRIIELARFPQGHPKQPETAMRP